nr:tyrosine-type recombinase/integrase [uncultured Desulfobacter sp.]
MLDYMSGTNMLMVRLIYGSGIRLMECIRLRIQDMDFGQGQIYVRDGNTVPPIFLKSVADELRQL